MPARAAPRPSSGRTLAGSPGTSKRRRHLQQRREQKQRDRRLLEVEALGEVRGGGGDDNGDRKLPGAQPAPGERAREPDRADPEGKREHPRGLRPAWRQNALDELEATRHLRRQRRGDPDHADDRGTPGEEPLRTGQAGNHVTRVQKVHEGIARALGVRIPLPRWVTLLLILVAAGLVPWTLYLTFALPSRHVTSHYDLAWVGFDVALTASFAAHRLGGVPRFPVARPTRGRHRDDARLRRVVRRRDLAERR